VNQKEKIIISQNIQKRQAHHLAKEPTVSQNPQSPDPRTFAKLIFGMFGLVIFIIFGILFILIVFSIIHKSPVEECAELCAGDNPTSYLKTECRTYCSQLKYYGGDEAVQNAIIEYKDS